MAERLRLKTAVRRLVRERLQRNEMILDWSERHGVVTVRFITKAMHRTCAPIAKRFGRGAGCGRVFSFEKRDGKWAEVGVGRWIS